MNKLFTKIAAFALGSSMAIGVGVAVASNSREATPVHAADSLAYTITLKDSGNSSDGTAAKTALNDIVSSGGSYVSSVSASYVYQGKSNCGVKLGSGNYAGVLTLNLSSTGQVKATKVVFELAAANDTGKTIKLSLNGATSGTGYTTYTTGSTTGSFADKELAWDGSTTLTSIKVDTTAKKFRTYLKSIKVYTAGSTPLTGITLGGAASSNAMSIGSSDLTAKTVSVTLNPSGATDQKVNIAHQSGTSGLFTVSSSATCTSGSGSFTVTGKGNTSGSETFRIKGNTETGVYVDLVVTALDDSVTYWTVSFDTDGGASVADMSVEDGEKFEFPSPGTKEHYSFDGWSSDGGNTLYDAGDESPAVGDDIEYTAYWTEDAKYTVTYVHGDHGTGNNYVVNNVYGGSYTLATFATAGFTASSGYSFKKWSVGGVEYAEGATVTISGATTVTAVYQEVATYTIVTSVANLVEDTTFVLVYETSGSYYVDTAITSNHVALTAKTAATTISNGVSSGSTLVSTEAMVLTLKGSEGAWKIKCGDQYLKFTGSSNGNDAFDTEANASTFSASIKDNKYILFTCTSSTGSGRVWRMNTSSKDMRNYATNSGVGDVYMFAYIPPQNELSSIALSGDYKTSFNSGEAFSFGGTVTASYTIDSDKTVTGSTTFHLDSASGTNMSGVTMTHAAHDGHTIYAKYTEGGITKTATYEISVANAPVSSVTITTHAAEVGFKEDYLITGITPTVLPADAVQTTEWVVSANTVSNDYTWNGTKLTSGETEGTITLRCRSTADNSKYDELVVTVTGDPTAEFTPASVSGYVGKSDDIEFTYGNMSDTSLISITSSNSSIAEVDEFVADAGEGLVTVNFVAAGSATLSISYDGGSTLDSITVTVSADSVTALTWSAPTIKVYSGATTTVSDASSWNVHYTMASGDEGDLSYGEYTLKLGGSSITLPHTWDASEDGKVLSIEYGGFASPTTSTVNVTQTLRAINASDTSAWDYTFTAKVWSAAGSETLDDKAWTMSGTGNGYWGYDATKGQQFGSGSNPYSALTLSSSAFSGTIASVTVYTSGAKDINATVQVSVGGTAYGDAQTITATNTDYTFDLGGKSGTISIDYVNSSSKAIYIKEIVVNTVSGSHNIANVAGHEAAQKAVVAFAKAMNAAFDNTENCTDGVAAAWATASSAYSSNIANNASLSADEKAYAKNLIKYASAQYTDDTDNDYSYCLERAMATYEACIQKHGQTAFMSDVRQVNAARVNPLAINVNNASSIVIVLAMLSLTVYGGYFFLRKKKED